MVRLSPLATGSRSQVRHALKLSRQRAPTELDEQDARPQSNIPRLLQTDELAAAASAARGPEDAEFESEGEWGLWGREYTTRPQYRIGLHGDEHQPPAPEPGRQRTAAAVERDRDESARVRADDRGDESDDDAWALPDDESEFLRPTPPSQQQLLGGWASEWPDGEHGPHDLPQRRPTYAVEIPALVPFVVPAALEGG